MLESSKNDYKVLAANLLAANDFDAVRATMVIIDAICALEDSLHQAGIAEEQFP